MEKSASGSRSIVEMYSSQHSKNQSCSQDTISNFAPVPLLSTELRGKKSQVVETLFELRTRAVQDLTDLLSLKTKQIDTYGHMLDPKSNFHRRHRMVQRFLWMQVNKEKDSPGLTRQKLARIVAQTFNKRTYTGQKIVQWERSWMTDRVILCTKARTNKHHLS